MKFIDEKDKIELIPESQVDTFHLGVIAGMVNRKEVVYTSTTGTVQKIEKLVLEKHVLIGRLMESNK